MDKLFCPCRFNNIDDIIISKYLEEDNMVQLLLAVIYLSFISLGLPDGLLGAAWPTMYGEFGVPVSYAGVVSMIIAFGTIMSSLASDRLTLKLGTGKVTAISVAMTALALLGFSISDSFSRGPTRPSSSPRISPIRIRLSSTSLSFFSASFFLWRFCLAFRLPF